MRRTRCAKEESDDEGRGVESGRRQVTPGGGRPGHLTLRTADSCNQREAGQRRSRRLTKPLPDAAEGLEQILSRARTPSEKHAPYRTAAAGGSAESKKLARTTTQEHSQCGPQGAAGMEPRPTMCPPGNVGLTRRKGSGDTLRERGWLCTCLCASLARGPFCFVRAASDVNNS